MPINEAAARGFSAAPEVYERGRPSYPGEAIALLVDELDVTPTALVVDVGAGTGKLARLLVPTGATVVAVEPVAEMRAVLAETVEGVEVHDATAESLPLDEGVADAVVCAQAFHWFRQTEALVEFARVLRPGGGVGLVWNEKDDSVPWVAELDRLTHARRRDEPSYVGSSDDIAGVVDDTGWFTPLRKRTFPHAQELTADGLVDRVLSTSYIATLPEEARQALSADVRSLVAGFPAHFPLPYRTDVFWCRRA